METQKNIVERISHTIEKMSERPKIAKVLVYFELLRTRNCVITFFGVYLGAAIVLGVIPLEHPLSATIFVAASAVFLITAGGNALNDYFDYEIDKINKPHRPLPSGKITKNDASMLGLALVLVGVGMANYVNQYCLYLAILNSVIIVVYARYSKKLLLVSNMCVSYMVGSIFLFGGLAAGFINAGMALLLTLIVCAFLITLSREIVKDIEDIEGDKRRYAITLPINLGIEKSRNIASIFGLAAIIFSAFPLILDILKNLLGYAILIVLADLIFIYTFFLEPKDAQKIMVLGMAIAIIAFFAGAVF